MFYQPHHVVLSGFVMGCKNGKLTRPISPAIVMLRSDGCNYVLGPVQVDNMGFFKFKNLPIGLWRYKLIVRVENSEGGRLHLNNQDLRNIQRSEKILKILVEDIWLPIIPKVEVNELNEPPTKEMVSA